MFPMKMIEDYKILAYTNPEQLETEVKDRLKNGWTILGSAQITYNPKEDGNTYAQVMIKVAEK